MTISVIIPAYNAGTYIDRCLDSVMSPDAEVLVVDDGSVDNTAQRVTDRVEKEPRIRLVSQANAGVSAARNKGMSMAMGEWIIFVDSDDYLFPDALDEFVKRIPEEKDLVVMRSFCGSEERYPWPGGNNGLFIRGSVCGCAFRRAFLEEKKLHFREDLSLSEDYLFFAEILNAGARMSYVDLSFYQVVMNEGSSSRKLAPDYFTRWGKTLKAATEVLDNEAIRAEVCMGIIMGMCNRAGRVGYSPSQLKKDISLDDILPIDASSLSGTNSLMARVLNCSFGLFFRIKKLRDSSLVRRFFPMMLLFLSPWLAAAPVGIRSQEEFCSLGKEIQRQIEEGEKVIDISFESGTYYFPDNLITLVGVDAPGVIISIEGNGSSFIGAGAALDNGDRTAEYSFKTGWTEMESGQPRDMRGPVGLCRFYPIPTNLARTSFRIPTREKDLSEEDAKDVYVIITQWYKGIVFKVDKIKRGWIYYHETEPSPTRWYTELRFGRCLPRYQMLNRPEGDIAVVDGSIKTDNRLYRSDASCFLYARDSRIGSISIRNCRFDGNDGASPLMFLHSVEADSLSISSCHIRGIRGDGISVWNTGNVRFYGNEACGNYRSVLTSDSFSDSTLVSGNVFRDNGLSFSNDPVVLCQGADLLIENNFFEDFTYSAISLGLHYSYDFGDLCSGHVRNNEICHTAAFRNKPMRSIIDGGAIYVYTRNKNIVISGNYVHDISGHHGNRGIFCDDGVNNVTIEGNKVLRIENSYPIDLRHYEKVSRIKGSHVVRGNMHNRIIGNTVDAKCRLYIRKDDSKSEIRDNVCL